MRRLPDKVACRNMIKRSRQYHRGCFKSKHMTIHITKEEGYMVSLGVEVKYNNRTGCVSTACAMTIDGMRIFPGRHQRRTCTNLAGKTALKKRRESVKNANKNYKVKYYGYNFDDDGGHKISSILSVRVNTITGKFNCYHLIDYKNKRLYFGKK